jgi:hypothetical protein
MLEPVEQDIRRRSSGGALVGPRGRGVRWGPGAQQGDVLLAGGAPVILRSDDGDGWLSEHDRALGVVRGRIREGTLSDFPGVVQVLRPRLFITWREHLTAAGYGELGQSSSYTADLAQACREFQRDQSLPETGFPDAETEAMLDGVLAAMDAAETPTSSSDR